MICLSTADWDAPLWTNKQHLMARLAARGVRVLYVDSVGLRRPGRNARDMRRIASRVTSWRPYAEPVGENIIRDSPLAVPGLGAWGNALNRSLLSARMTRNRRRLHMSRPVIWTYTPVASNLIAASDAAPIIYHCVDDLAAYPGIDGPAFRKQERALIDRADVCIASSRPLTSSLENRGARRVLYWPNPADVALFSLAPDHRSKARPKIGFIGAIQEHKVDVPLVIALARARPEWDFELVGPLGLGLSDSKVGTTEWPVNVSLSGLVPLERLAAKVQAFDVGLIPYRLNDYTRSVFPMKVFEYLAAGVGVVSTPLPSLVGEVEHVAFASTSDEMIRAIERILRADANGSAARLARASYAQGYSWEARTDQALELLSSLGAT